jgi:hypothetical protein
MMALNIGFDASICNMLHWEGILEKGKEVCITNGAVSIVG